MKRGDQELKCLEYVRKNWRQIQFPEMSPSERTSFLEFLNAAEPNPQASDFPDFVLKDGFIEQFQINGSRETRKGMAHNIEVSKFEKHCAEVSTKLPEWEGSGPVEVHVRKDEMNVPAYSREDFLKSFKKHFNSHMDSFHKYKKCSGFRTFLVENTGVTFGVYQNEKYTCELYRLSLDAELLDYLSEYAGELTYVIFRSAQLIEVIALDKITAIKKRIPDGITFQAGQYHNVNVTLCIDLSL